MDVTETMVPLVQAFGALLVALGLAYRLAGLRIFNLLVPKDSGADVIARDLSYGSHARQRLDLYRPLQSGGRLPLVIFVHGGVSYRNHQLQAGAPASVSCFR
jgi:acetyl esterase/lipase